VKKRILLADPSKELLRQILHAPEHQLYQFETATSGHEMEDRTPPDLSLQIFFPKSGIEILVSKFAAEEDRHTSPLLRQ
jgi:hypothetical protein